jgi:hypothetical protein
MSEQRPIRRIVTGNDPDGRSRIVEDGPSPAIRRVAERPGYSVTNVWRTHGAAAGTDAPDDIADHRGVLPPRNGTVIRVIDFPPEPADPKEFERMIAATFRSLYPDATHQPDGAKHFGMHKTATIDYAVVLAGEVTAMMDQGETVMRAGDILIQRGTNHAWANRSGRPARIMFILIDAQ